MMLWQSLWFYLQVLLDVLAIICDTTGCDAGFSHQLKADFPTQIIWNLTFLKKQNTLNHAGVTGEMLKSGLFPFGSV